MARFNSKQYSQALFESLQSSPKDQGKILENFASLLVGNHDRTLTPNIIRHLKRFLKEKANTNIVSLTTAKKADPELLAQIQKSFDNNVQIQERVNPEAIGGVKIVINDEEVIDGTFKSRIEKLFKN